MCWACIEHVLCMCWACIEHVFNMHWACIGHVLCMCCACVGHVLGMCCACLVGTAPRASSSSLRRIRASIHGSTQHGLPSGAVAKATTSTTLSSRSISSPSPAYAQYTSSACQMHVKCMSNACLVYVQAACLSECLWACRINLHRHSQQHVSNSWRWARAVPPWPRRWSRKFDSSSTSMSARAARSHTGGGLLLPMAN